MIEDRIEVNIAGGLDVALPRMVNVRQKFDSTHLGDIPATVLREFLEDQSAEHAAVE